jgi:hypothetical protein
MWEVTPDLARPVGRVERKAGRGGRGKGREEGGPSASPACRQQRRRPARLTGVRASGGTRIADETPERVKDRLCDQRGSELMGADKNSSPNRELGLCPEFTTKDSHTGFPR